jgi:glycosyltransferase involved in cell wall biosynthesis
MDCFAFPSIYEGLGEALVEAEVSGLPCIASTDVPAAAKINDACVRLDCKQRECWIQWLSNCNKVLNRENFYNNALHGQYDISRTVSMLEEIYDM